MILFMSKNAFEGVKQVLEKRNFIAKSVVTNSAKSFNAKTKNIL